MDLFLTLWLLDDRWLFGLCPVLPELLFAIPTALNIVFFSLILSYKVGHSCNSIYSYLDILILSGILIILHFSFLIQLIITRSKYIQHSSSIQTNASQASSFIYRLNLKRTAWSISSFLIFFSSLILLGLNRKYLQNMECGNIIVQIYFYFNCVFVGYVAIMFMVFWGVKIVYLVVAWKFPKYNLVRTKVI